MGLKSESLAIRKLTQLATIVYLTFEIQTN